MFRVFKKKQEDLDDQQVIESAESVAVAEMDEQPAPVPAPAAAVSQPDISASQRAHSADLFRSLLSGMYDALLIVDDKGYIMQSNERAREFFRYEEGDMWNMNCSQLVPQLNMQVLYKIREHISQHRFTVVNAVCQRQDNTTFPGEIAISSIVMGNDVNMVLSIRNCERRNKTMHMNRIRDKALKYTGVGILSCSLDGAIEYANPAFQKLARSSSMADVLACNISEFFKQKEQCKALKESPTSSSSWQGAVELTTMDENKIRVQANSAKAEEVSSGSVHHSLVITISLMPGSTVANVSHRQ
jgi:PAS domain S-box-containing protein